MVITEVSLTFCEENPSMSCSSLDVHGLSLLNCSLKMTRFFKLNDLHFIQAPKNMKFQRDSQFQNMQFCMTMTIGRHGPCLDMTLSVQRCVRKQLRFCTASAPSTVSVLYAMTFHHTKPVLQVLITDRTMSMDNKLIMKL